MVVETVEMLAIPEVEELLLGTIEIQEEMLVEGIEMAETPEVHHEGTTIAEMEDATLVTENLKPQYVKSITHTHISSFNTAHATCITSEAHSNVLCLLQRVDEILASQTRTKAAFAPFNAPPHQVLVCFLCLFRFVLFVAGVFPWPLFGENSQASTASSQHCNRCVFDMRAWISRLINKIKAWRACMCEWLLLMSCFLLWSLYRNSSHLSFFFLCAHR
jgi:hypothetical protein